MLENPVELMFVENGSCYSKELLNDYKAYDTFNGVTRDLSSNVIVDWGGFDPTIFQIIPLTGQDPIILPIKYMTGKQLYGAPQENNPCRI